MPTVQVLSPSEIVRSVQRYNSMPAVPHVNEGIRGVLVGETEKLLTSLAFYALGGMVKEVPSLRLTLLGWVFGKPEEPLDKKSSKTLTEQQWYAWYRWSKITKDDITQAWITRDGYRYEVQALAFIALSDWNEINRADRGKPIQALRFFHNRQICESYFLDLADEKTRFAFVTGKFKFQPLENNKNGNDNESPDSRQ